MSDIESRPPRKSTSLASFELALQPRVVPKVDHSQRIGIGATFGLFVVLAALTAALPPTHNLSDAVQAGGGTAAMLNSGDTAWIIVASCMVLFMTPGLAFFYGGMVQEKNVISTMYQSFVALGAISVLWVIVGFSLAFGKDANDNGIIGYPRTFYMYNDVGPNPHPLLAPTVPLVVFSMFQLMFAIITPALIAGSLAERVNFSAWMLFISIWHLIVYCPLAHMMWHPDGVFRKWGALDFAGGTVVEMASGFSALAGALYLGPRRAKEEKPASIPFIMLGTAIFWFGWIGFNAGSAGAANGISCMAFATTNTAGASAMLTWIFLDFLRGKPTSAVGACNGIVVGLVAITPGCGFVTVGSSMVIGALACLICYTAGHFMKTSRVDDSLDVLTVHGLGGLVGFLCTGIFCTTDVNPAGAQGLIYGTGDTLAKHIAIVLCLVPCLLVSTYGIFYVVDFIIPVRVTQEEEELGLDRSMHSEEYSFHSTDNNKRSKSKSNAVSSETEGNTVNSEPESRAVKYEIEGRFSALDKSNHSVNSIDEHALKTSGASVWTASN